MKIPFNRPCFQGNETVYISQAIQNGHISGDGSFTKRCHEYFEKTLEVHKALLTSSCTDALEMSAILLDIKEGDEVILPSFTFVSTANAFVLRGAKPIFVDIRPDTLNLNEDLVVAKITSKTKAIVVVHYAGVGCEMDSLMSIAAKHNIAIVEDNAHGLFGKFRGKYLGKFGDMATQSFHETKNFTSGEGGALLINNPELVARAEIIREKGTNRARFFRGQVDKYSWVDIGSSFLPSDLTAAFLLAQLEARDLIQEKRKQIWERYYDGVSQWALRNNVGLPFIPNYCEQAYHMFYLLMPSLEKRHDFINHLKSMDIMSVFHYLPLHLSDMGKMYGGMKGDCPITEDISDRLVRLPFFNDITEVEQSRVIKAIKDFGK